MMKKKSLEWRNCSEENLSPRIKDFVSECCVPGTILLLEGEMGAGKSFFARTVIHHLSKNSQSRGSPTFPLLHEYRADAGFLIYHLDLYRIRSDEEIYHSGILEQIEDPAALVLVEWSSLFPGVFSSSSPGFRKRNLFRIEIQGSGDFRNYSLERLNG